MKFSSIYCLFIAYFIQKNSAEYYDFVLSLYGKKLRSSNFQLGYNDYFRGRSRKSISKMMGALLSTTETSIRRIGATNSVYEEIPPHFHAAEKWPKCESTINHIKDQSDCGSCWAVAASEVIADRTCIANYDSMTGDEAGPALGFSAENIMTCCKPSFGCNGGYTLFAMKYWCTEGVVTGGSYGSQCGCQPYEIPPCIDGRCKWPVGKTPNCSDLCQSQFPNPFPADKHYCSDHYLLPSDVESMQREIMEHGPIECVYKVYENFIIYKTGVYDEIDGRELGGHAVKVIGWGEHRGTPYWIINNSWNRTWGMNGVFWMLRGQNFCGIESYCVSGLARKHDRFFKLRCFQ